MPNALTTVYILVLNPFPVDAPATPPSPIQKQSASTVGENQPQPQVVPEVNAASETVEETVSREELFEEETPANQESPNTDGEGEDVPQTVQSEPESGEQQPQKPFLQAQLEKASKLGYNALDVPVNTPGTPSPRVQRKLTLDRLDNEYQPEVIERANPVLNGLNQFKVQQFGEQKTLQLKKTAEGSEGEEQQEPTQIDETSYPASNQNQLIAVLPAAIPVAIITAEGIKWITVTVIVTAGVITIKWWNDYGEEVVRELGEAKDWTVEKITEFVQGVFMAAEGNVVHDHIVREARERAVEAGWAETEGAVTIEMICQMLKIMQQEIERQPRRSRDTDKLKKIKSTSKGLGCRHSRHS
ncbi:MAG TPA: hypothetical protein DCL61_19855 [Cyanobacteria bacterium UBA12227]|nr:hypothetical protein [Cyanobacteria bacterium UBA12227]HAX90579.1 hypothetical protein [Cyanobacteria bacterium UBA11370]HBY81275.1 hypothetical protein [Cyanobacteria bacterium UBA11148]